MITDIREPSSLILLPRPQLFDIFDLIIEIFDGTWIPALKWPPLAYHSTYCIVISRSVALHRCTGWNGRVTRASSVRETPSVALLVSVAEGWPDWKTVERILHCDISFILAQYYIDGRGKEKSQRCTDHCVGTV